MPRVGLEPTIPALERTKTVHALDRAATVICDNIKYTHCKHDQHCIPDDGRKAEACSS
jgi:hypothetical protein